MDEKTRNELHSIGGAFENMSDEEWERFKMQTINHAKNLQTLDEQIDAERQAEDEYVSKLTDEQRLEYLTKKQQRVDDFAKENKLNQATLRTNKKN